MDALRWEYYWFTAELGKVSSRSTKVEWKFGSTTLDEKLDKLGKQGWELISVFPLAKKARSVLLPRSQGSTYGPGHNSFDLDGYLDAMVLQFFFKRPVNEGSASSKRTIKKAGTSSKRSNQEVLSS
jgi:hypothetical protein